MRYDADQAFVLPERPEGELRYAVETAPAGDEPLAGLAARHPDPRYTQVPEDDPDLPRIAALAGVVVAGARDDAERVRRVLAWFETFDYDLEQRELEGAGSIARFLDLRSGYCTYFAAASVLMLRTQGLSARIATGFLAHERTGDDSALVVRERDAHAWIEVYFDRPGWTTFDPTPALQRELALAGGRGADGLGWWARLRTELENWTARAGSLADVAAVLLEGPAALLSGRRSAWLLLPPAAIALVLLLRRRTTGAARVDAAGGSPWMPREKALLERVLDALSALGHVPNSACTRIEFARETAGKEGRGWEDLERLLALFDRARFGGRGLSPDEERRIEGFLARIRPGSPALPSRES
jgi:protein-glutamine gamma-glutamyltransferase